MEGTISKYYKKLCAIRWIIGFSRCDIAEIIRSGNFEPEIKWMKIPNIKKFFADPFICSINGKVINVLYEEFLISENYGIISSLQVDDSFQIIDNKILLDIKKRLSYPFIFNEDGKTYVLPEASRTGKLSCYEYEHQTRSVRFVKDLIHAPLLDSTILKYNEKYWVFSIQNMNDINYELLIFHSDNLFGPYQAHLKNPVKVGLNGLRPAGDFIKVDGSVYRPAQNCERSYGESITVFRIKTLNESDFEEEFHMKVEINRKNKQNRHIHSIHTINSFNDLLVVDGEKWIFSPHYRFWKLIKERSK